MFGKLLNLFKKKEVVEESPYSITIGDISIPVPNKRCINKEISEIVDKSLAGEEAETMSLTDINKLIGFYFNEKPIERGLFVPNAYMFNGMTLLVTKVTSKCDKRGDLESMLITMSDQVYNSSLTITVEVRDFHEFFKFFDISKLTNPPKPSSETNKC